MNALKFISNNKSHIIGTLFSYKSNYIMYRWGFSSTIFAGLFLTDKEFRHDVSGGSFAGLFARTTSCSLFLGGLLTLLYPVGYPIIIGTFIDRNETINYISAKYNIDSYLSKDYWL